MVTEGDIVETKHGRVGQVTSVIDASITYPIIVRFKADHSGAIGNTITYTLDLKRLFFKDDEYDIVSVNGISIQKQKVKLQW